MTTDGQKLKRLLLELVVSAETYLLLESNPATNRAHLYEARKFFMRRIEKIRNEGGIND